MYISFLCFNYENWVMSVIFTQKYNLVTVPLNYNDGKCLYYTSMDSPNGIQKTQTMILKSLAKYRSICAETMFNFMLPSSATRIYIDYYSCSFIYSSQQEGRL